MENLEQALLEAMADWLNREETIFEMRFLNLTDNEYLHIKMANAAFDVFKRQTIADECKCIRYINGVNWYSNGCEIHPEGTSLTQCINNKAKTANNFIWKRT